MPAERYASQAEQRRLEAERKRKADAAKAEEARRTPRTPVNRTAAARTEEARRTTTAAPAVRLTPAQGPPAQGGGAILPTSLPGPAPQERLPIEVRTQARPSPSRAAPPLANVPPLRPYVGQQTSPTPPFMPGPGLTPLQEFARTGRIPGVPSAPIGPTFLQGVGSYVPPAANVPSMPIPGLPTTAPMGPVPPLPPLNRGQQAEANRLTAMANMERAVKMLDVMPPMSERGVPQGISPSGEKPLKTWPEADTGAVSVEQAAAVSPTPPEGEKPAEAPKVDTARDGKITPDDLSMVTETNWVELGFPSQEVGSTWAKQVYNTLGYWPWEGDGTPEENLALAIALYYGGGAPAPGGEPAGGGGYGGGGYGGYGGGGGYSGGGYSGYQQPIPPWFWANMQRGI